MELYYVKLSYACYGLIVRDNKVSDVAPIAKWMIGKDIENVKNWIRKKNGEIVKI